MSQENLELVKRFNKRGHAIAARGDEAELKAFIAEFFAADVVMTIVEAPADQPSVFQGHEAVISQWTAMIEVFDDFHREVDEVVDAGEWVVTVGHWIGRGKASGAVVRGATASALRIRDGKVVEHIIGFPTKDDALEAVGPRE